MSDSIFFVTGIGTDIGKTIVSAILVEALQADYWKPIQSGDTANNDTQKVKNLVSNTTSVFHTESYVFQTPASPHIAAAIENKTIDLAAINLPNTANTLIVEGAGGLMVPLNEEVLMIDVIQKINAKAIIVTNDYLGSINHTLLTVEALEKRNIPIAGFIINGECKAEIKQTFLHFIPYQLIAQIPQAPLLSKEFISEQAALVKRKVQQFFES